MAVIIGKRGDCKIRGSMLDEHVGTRDLLKRLLGYILPYRPLLLTGVLAIPFSLASATLQPWILAYIIDGIFLKHQPELLRNVVWYFLAIVLVGYVADSIYNYALQKVGQLSIFDMRQSAFERCMKFPRRYFDKTPTGVLLTRLTSDFEAMGESIASGFLTILIDMLKTSFLFGVLLYLNWRLAFLLIVILIPAMFLSGFLRKRLKIYYQRARSALALATGYLHECLAGMKTIQLYNAEKKIHQRYLHKHEAFLNAQKSTNVFETVLFSFVEGITALSISIILWGGVRFSLENVLTVGVLITFINTLQKIFVPIREFAQQNAAIQRSLAALRNIDLLFRVNIIEESEDAAMVHDTFKSLEFIRVKFRYAEDQPYVLHGISFTLNAGERLAMVGATGSGKSTVIRILSKQYTNYEGSILLNGKELKRYTQAEVQTLMTVMHQDAFLFDETIQFNIALDRETIGEQEMYDASGYVKADTFIDRLPKKYDFVVQGRGGNLSSGQGQLINFSRVIAGGALLIALDEATSSVDSITENLIEQAMEKIFMDKTVIAIAHRLSTIQNSDIILVFENGTIAESGKHNTLLALGGYYAKLYGQTPSAPNETAKKTI